MKIFLFIKDAASSQIFYYVYLINAQKLIVCEN